MASFVRSVFVHAALLLVTRLLLSARVASAQGGDLDLRNSHNYIGSGDITGSSCISFAHDLPVSSAFIQLFSEDGPLIHAELASVRNRISASTSLAEGSNWKLCVGIEVRGREAAAVDAAPAVTLQKPDRTSQALSTSAVFVTVDYFEDSAIDIYACSVVSSGLCNFRSAVAFCESELSSPDRACSVLLPDRQTLHMDPSLGEMSVAGTASGFFAIEGNGCTILPSSGLKAVSRLMSIEPAASIAVVVSNLIIHFFGDGALDGGVIQLIGLKSVELVNVSFVSSTGETGGSLYIASSRNVALSQCSFNNVSSVFSGGAIYIALSQNVTISNCLFNKTLAGSYGGAIHIDESTNVTISNSTFKGTASDVHAGAIMVHRQNTDVRITHCVFIESSAKQMGGAIYLFEHNRNVFFHSCIFTRTMSGFDGGSIFLGLANLDVTIDRGIFSESLAGKNGGALYLDEANTGFAVFDSEFDRSAAPAGGGGAIYTNIYNNGVRIAHCRFYRTSAIYGGAVYLEIYNDNMLISKSIFNGTSSFGEGGAVFASMTNKVLAMLDCIFKDTIAEKRGGAVYFYSGNTNATILNCKFEATRSELDDGGAINADFGSHFLTISHSTFVSNRAMLSGGAIALGEDSEDSLITACTFFNISAWSGGAIYVWNRNLRVSIIDSSFLYTFSTGGGGAIFIHFQNENMLILRCKFSYSKSDVGGGAIVSYSLNLYLGIHECIFDNNWSVSGGSIYLFELNYEFYISGCTFQNTFAVEDAGTIMIFNYNHYGDVHNSSFINASAGANGGAIQLRLFNSHFTLLNCFFANTSAGLNGGSIDIESFHLLSEITGCRFWRSSAGNNGGSIYLLSGNEDFVINSTSFTSSYATRGGAMYVGNRNELMIIGSKFSSNHASADGGALLIQDSNDGALISDSVFDNNIANEYGGAIAVVSTNKAVNIVGCTFTTNSASSGGGAIQSSFANSKIQILDCKFRNNFASFGGGVYFGDYHDGITLESAVFTNNTAEYGAGVYVTQFNSIVQFTDVVFEENAAIKDGGAIFMLAKDSTFTRNRIVRNVASSGGGMLYGGDSFIMTACVVEENYGLSGKFGGIILELMTSTTILFTLFRANRGNAGGALSIIDCKNVTIHNCTFDANESREAHGGAIFAVQSNAVVSATVFGSNTAKIDGGAIYANSANNFTTSKCVFLGNSAKSGSGSAEWMSGLFNAHVIDNIYSGNDALFGGGTVYWAVSSGMSEPPNILTSNHFAGDNAAFYGSDVATDAHLLQVDSSNVYSVTDYESPAPSIVTHVVDFYGQIVRTESAGLIVASILSDAQCYKSTGYVTGGFVEPLVSGTSNFTTLYAYCDPGYDMLVNLTSITGSLLLRNYFKLSFRACVRGEYYGDSVCNLCEEGTYSLTDPLITPLDDLGQQTVCRDCPEGSLGCYGDTITLEEGYWRISDLATTILKCPLAHSCGGGSGHGDLLCRDGYEGPLCGICSDGYAYRSSTKGCELCSKSSNVDVMIILLICMVVMATLIALHIYYFTDFCEKVRNIDDLYLFLFQKLGLLDRASSVSAATSDFGVRIGAREMGRRFKARLKIYINLWQIVSLLPFTLNLQFPNAYAVIASALSVFNLNISTSSMVTCSAGKGYDAIDALIVSTIYPIAVVLLLKVVAVVHTRMRARLDHLELSKIRASYFSVFLVFTYLILPFTSVQIFQTFSCQDVDPDEVYAGENQYMTADYSVSCSSKKYEFGFAWAIMSIFVYPLGIPLYYFYVLYSARHDIMSRDDSITSARDLDSKAMRLNSLRLLYEYYQPRFWYWEVVETINRLFLTGVLVVISQGSATQIIVGIAVSMFFVKLGDVYRPFMDAKVQTIKEISMWQIFIIFLLALILKGDFPSVNDIALDVLFVLAILSALILDIIHTFWAQWKLQSKNTSNDEIELKLRTKVSNPMTTA